MKRQDMYTLHTDKAGMTATNTDKLLHSANINVHHDWNNLTLPRPGAINAPFEQEFSTSAFALRKHLRSVITWEQLQQTHETSASFLQQYTNTIPRRGASTPGCDGQKVHVFATSWHEPARRPTSLYGHTAFHRAHGRQLSQGSIQGRLYTDTELLLTEHSRSQDKATKLPVFATADARKHSLSLHQDLNQRNIHLAAKDSGVMPLPTFATYVHSMEEADINEICATEWYKVEFDGRQLFFHYVESLQHLEQGSKYTCTPCQFKFLARDDFQHHLMWHKHTRKLRCPACGKGFGSEAGLEAHREANPKNACADAAYECNICQKKVLHLRSLRAHRIKQHSIDKRGLYLYMPELDKQKTQNENAEKVHEQNGKHHKENDNEVCKSKEKKMTKNRRNSGAKQAPSKIAQRKTLKKTQAMPNQIIKAASRAPRSRKVRFAQEVTPKGNNATAAEKRSEQQENPPINSGVTPKPQPRPMCEFCGRNFSNRSILRKHYLVHSDYRPYRCDVCDRKFRDKANFRVHFMSHSGERPHSCPQCKAAFIRRDFLRHHMKLHTKQGLFTCKICGKKSTRKYDAAAHMRKHTRERLYHCTQCSKSYCWRGDLTAHMKTHSGELSVVCDICQKKYPDKRSMRQHYLTHTKGVPFKCDECALEFPYKRGRDMHLMRSDYGTYGCTRCTIKFVTECGIRQHARSHGTEAESSEQALDNIEIECL